MPKRRRSEDNDASASKPPGLATKRGGASRPKRIAVVPKWMDVVSKAAMTQRPPPPKARGSLAAMDNEDDDYENDVGASCPGMQLPATGDSYLCGQLRRVLLRNGGQCNLEALEMEL